MENMSVFIFFSYSHEDEVFKDELQKHLSILQRKGYIKGWSDRQITPGAEWEEEINLNLQKANLILLLVSADFLASDYCYDTETIFALEQHEKGNAIVVPIIIRPCFWSQSHFNMLQALPIDGIPITRWEDQDEAWLKVTEGILEVIKKINSKKIQPEKNNIVNINSVSGNINFDNTDSNNNLKEILIRFLNTYYNFYFSPLRIQQWGGKRLGFESLKNYTTKEIKEELENLMITNKVKRILSQKGNMIYKITSH